MRLVNLLPVFFGLFLSSCASHGGSELLSSGPRYVSSADLESYKLAPNDRVRLTVFNEAGLSGEFLVAPDGFLTLPLIGQVKAENRTKEEILAEVGTRLGSGYLRNPSAIIEIINYRPFFVLGEVRAPGQYPYSSGMTLLNAIATAEGFSARANKKIAFIRDEGGTTEAAYRISPDLRIKPGDTIRIGERYF